MAVATHVSRVAKDYAPFGYSVMETIIAQGKSAVGAPSTDFYSVMVDDADIYIESIELIGIDAVAKDTGTGFLTLDVKSWASGEAGSVTHASGTTANITAGVALVANVWRSLTVSNPVVAKGRYVVFRVTKSAVHADLNSKRVQCAIRYRRKA